MLQFMVSDRIEHYLVAEQKQLRENWPFRVFISYIKKVYHFTSY